MAAGSSTLIIGAGGMLGSDLVSALQTRKSAFIPLTRKDLDITSAPNVREVIRTLRPSAVINCAAYTDVDGCENNYETAFATNARGVGNLATACRGTGARLVHISTDYVFDGTKDAPYTEEDEVNPLGIYGMTKEIGERLIRENAGAYTIIRTQWLFGRNGKNFVKTILNLAKTRDELTIVADQVGSPTYTPDLADAVVDLLNIDVTGIFNITNSGQTTWYSFAQKILELSSIKNVTLKKITSAELSRPAMRPMYSALDNSKFFNLTGRRLRPWEAALEDYLELLKAESD